MRDPQCAMRAGCLTLRKCSRSCAAGAESLDTLGYAKCLVSSRGGCGWPGSPRCVLLLAVRTTTAVAPGRRQAERAAARTVRLQAPRVLLVRVAIPLKEGASIRRVLRIRAAL